MFGIIGNPLQQSFSPQYFRKKFEALSLDETYEKFELETIAELPEILLTHSDLQGFNVTIPYKQQIIPFLDELDEVAAKVGAVNCVKITDGKLKGFNTDAIGFEKALTPLLKPHHAKALVLGTGGASKAVAFVLQKLNIPFHFVSRKGRAAVYSYEKLNAEIMAEHLLIINTTPLGMMPDVTAAPAIPYLYITPKHLLYDLIYNPSETKFLQQGKAHGATTKNGYDMLIAQAEAAWTIWQED